MKKANRRKLWKQMLSIMMAIVLTMGSVPVSALAAENTGTDSAQASEIIVETEEQESESGDILQEDEEDPDDNSGNSSTVVVEGNEGSTQVEADREDPSDHDEGQDASDEGSTDPSGAEAGEDEILPEEEEQEDDETESDDPAVTDPQNEEAQDTLQEAEQELVPEESAEDIASKYARLTDGTINIVDFTLYPGKNWLEILDESMCIAIFEPEIDDTYTFLSTGDKLKCATLYSNTWEELAFDIGDENDGNFRFSIELTAGSTYVILIEIEDGVPEEMQTIDVIGEKGLHTGTNYISVVSNEESILKFVPEQDGIHTFSFRGSEGFGLRLYDSDMELLAEHSHFKISYDLVAGETYYIAARTLKDDIRERLSLSVSFGTEQISVSDAVISVSNQTYTGKALTPKPVVTVEGETLTENTDYTLSYSNNVNAGTAKVTVTGKENYTGEASATFTINKAAPTLSYAKTALSKKTTDSAFTNTLTKKTDGKITYKSSNATIAAVDSASGKVTIKKAGKVRITATAAAGKNYKAGSASYTITIIVDYNLPKSLKLGVGQKYTLKPTFTKATYSSSSTSVAEVSATGVITAKKAGTTTIKAFSNKKQMASFKLTVVAAPSSVKLNPTAITLGVKEAYTLAPIIPSGSCASFTYSSKNKAIATVNANGVVKGVKAGKTTITVKTHNGKTANLTVTVKNAPSKVTLSPTSLTVGVSETYTLKPTIPSGTHASYTYSSKNRAIATVTTKGVVKGVKVGTTTITVTTHNGKTATVTVTVKKAPASITLGASAMSLGVGESYTIKPTIPADSHTTYTYTSSNSAILTVTSKGALKGIKVGKATITVTTHNSKKATLTVYVRKAPSKVTLNKSTLQLNEGDAFQLKATLPDQTASKITWKSSNAAVATVNSKGLVTAKGQGTAKITATTFNNMSASCTVTVYGDFVFSGQTLVGYNGSETTVTIPTVVADGSPVLAIADSAFEGNTTITEVIIPDTVKTIGDNAFKDCTALTTVNLPADLETIGEKAFYGDTALTSLDIPYGTVSIDSQAFANSSLEEIYLPETVESIGDDAFDGLPDVIFYSPAGSYADEYAQERDYQSENCGVHYREEQLQEQLALLEEFEVDEGESNEPFEPDYTLLDTEGIEDEELLQYIEAINESILASQTAHEDYLNSANSFPEEHNAALEGISDLDFVETEEGVEYVIGEFSFGIHGDAAEDLGSDFEIISASASEDQELLIMEVESGGKTFYFLEDASGITVYDEEAYLASAAPKNLRKISMQKAADISEGRLNTFLTYVKNQLSKWMDIWNFEIGKIKELRNKANAEKRACNEKIKKTEDLLWYEHKKYYESSGYDAEVWKVKIEDSKENLKRFRAEYEKVTLRVNSLDKVLGGLDAFNVIPCWKTITEDLERFFEVRSIKTHGHPTDVEAADPARSAIVADLQLNITRCYMAIGCEAGVATVDLVSALSNVVMMVSAFIGPAGLVTAPIGKITKDIALKAIKKFAMDFAERFFVGMASGYYYNIVKQDDDKLHFAVTGTVTDEQTGEPIARVKVTCGETKVFTNSQGKYSINAGTGYKTITFDKKGYGMQQRMIRIEDYSSTPLNVTLDPGGSIHGHVYDAATGEPLGGVTVKFGQSTTLTNSEGFYQLNVPIAQKILSFSKDGFIPMKFSYEVKAGIAATQDAALSRELEGGQYRVVLTWGATPADLDSHLEGPGFHVSYEDKDGPNAHLDVDDTTSYGPETVTFTINETGTYTYYVHDYTNRNGTVSGSLAYSGAKVSVYNGNKLIATYSVPDSVGKYWYVFKIVDGEYSAISSEN